MSSTSDANTPASSRSSKTAAASSSASKSIYTTSNIASPITRPRTKKNSHHISDPQVLDHGSRLSDQISSEGINSRFDVQSKMPANKDSGGFLLDPMSVFAKRKRTDESRRKELSIYPPDGQWEGEDHHNPMKHPSQRDSQDISYPRSDGVGSSSSSRPSTNDPLQSIRDAKGKGRASPLTDRAVVMDSASDHILRSSVSAERTRMPERSTHHQDLMNPTQIVQMALSLSESRRLHLGPGHLAPAGLAESRRVVSAGFAPPTGGWQGLDTLRGGSLRLPRLQPKDSLSTTFQPDRNSLSLPSVNGSSYRPSMEVSAPRLSDVQYSYDFSAATLSRAEKARAYFELSHQYRRLLGYLPPLKSHTSLGGQQALGRVYNPLQYIRNRQVRSRERQILDVNTTGWNHVDVVRLWVDTVEVESTVIENLSGDVLELPPWNQKLRTSVVQSNAPWLAPDPPEVSGMSTKAKWAKLDWSFTPAELLADAYWLEQDSNKALIETRKGNRIFDNFQRPLPTSPKSRQLSNGFNSDVAESPESAKYSPLSLMGSGRKSDVMENSRFREFSSPPQKRSKVSRVKRHLLRRHKDEDTMSVDSDMSDLDHLDIEDFDKQGSSRSENTGPLEKHMNKMLELESRNKARRSRRLSSVTSDQHGRRGGVSTVHSAGSGHPDRRSSVDIMSNRSSLEAYHNETPRISIEDIDDFGGRLSNATTVELDDSFSKRAPDDILVTKRHHHNPLSFLHRASKTKEKEKIEEIDFATTNGNNHSHIPESNGRPDDSPRSSIELTTRAHSYMSSNNHKSRSDAQRKSQDDLSGLSNPSQLNSASTKFFKGGRIGEIVRSERPRNKGFVWKRKAPRKGSSGSNGRELSFSESEDDANVHTDIANSRSLSTNDLTQGTYRAKNLPAFKPTSARGSTVDDNANRPATADHISRQSKAHKATNRRSRFDAMAPLSLQTSRTSITDISRVSDASSRRRHDRDRDRSPGDKRSSSRSRSGVRAADKRLNAVLRSSGGVGTGGLPVTGLSAVDARRRSSIMPEGGHRHWSIAADATKSEHSSSGTVTLREVAYVRTLLLASGIKANSIVSTANEPRHVLPEFLLRAAKVSNTSLGSIGRRQEHVLAARMLSQDLESTISTFEQAAERFRGETCAQLLSRIDDLREQVASKLTPVVRSCGDDADGFIAQLTTTHTLAIKQVNDSLELMMRRRSRRLRWLRKAAFALLEWTLVALMWWIWLFVYVLKIFKGLLLGCWRAVKWVSWN